MRVVLNGGERELPDGATVKNAVEASGAHESGRGVAVALNGVVVPRSQWETTSLAAGQRVEVLQAVQGG